MDEDREEGFSLVELLVVIVIIGILSAIAVGAFLSQRQKANDAAVESDMRTVITALETGYVDHPHGAPITSSASVGSPLFEGGDENADSNEIDISFFTDPDGTTPQADAPKDDIATVSLSDGVKLTVIPSTPSEDHEGMYDFALQPNPGDGYVIIATHTNGSKYTGESYDSMYAYSSLGGKFGTVDKLIPVYEF